jgi:hypothetical protein
VTIELWRLRLQRSLRPLHGQERPGRRRGPGDALPRRRRGDRRPRAGDVEGALRPRHPLCAADARRRLRRPDGPAAAGKLYRDKGFGFTTLAEAEADPFYRTDVDPSLPPEPTTLENALRAKGLPVPPMPVDLAALDRMCR